MRTLHIRNYTCTLEEKQATILLEADLIYECGDIHDNSSHDLHISPDGPGSDGWTLDEIELIFRTLAESL